MMLDELDRYIIISILDAYKKEKTTTTWDMAKKFAWTKEDKGIFFTESDETLFFTGKATLISKRLIKLEKVGLVKIVKEKQPSSNGKDIFKNTYFVLSDRVKKCQHKFMHKEAMALLVKDNIGKWTILEL
jgi:hypothetical protein